MDTEQLHHTIFPSPFGSMGVVWSASKGSILVRRVLLPGGDLAIGTMMAAWYPASTPSSCGEIENLCAGIAAFFKGDPVRFHLGNVALDQCSAFQRSVLMAEYAIPRGAVSTYRRIARHLERPSGARAVGNALAHNPFPIIIPCHRAIRSDLTLGGFQGGLDMKRRLLEMEGVRFDRAGRVVPEAFFY